MTEGFSLEGDNQFTTLSMLGKDKWNRFTLGSIFGVNSGILNIRGFFSTRGRGCGSKRTALFELVLLLIGTSFSVSKHVFP
jgi:hypothetical protein